MPQEVNEKLLREANESFQILLNISNLLKTGLEYDVLMCCVRLCEEGIPPEVLSGVILEVKKKCQQLRQSKLSQRSETSDMINDRSSLQS